MFYFHSSPSWKILINNTDLVSAERGGSGSVDAGSAVLLVGHRWQQVSVVELIIARRVSTWNTSGSVGRRVCFWGGWDHFQMSDSLQANCYILHAAKQIISSSLNSQDLHSLGRVLSSAQTQCANVVHNAKVSTNNLTRTTKQTTNKHPSLPSTVRSSSHRTFRKLQDLTEMNQSMCHKTNWREDK